MSILVVEDESDMADILSYILRRAGHEVLTASDGETGLRLWRQANPELVLLDLGLPRVSGWDVCRTIRNDSTTPIIVISGRNADEDVVECLNLGAEDFVSKPFSPKVLRARVGAVLRRSAASVAAPAPVPSDNRHLRFDERHRTVSCNGRKLHLTRIEQKLFSALSVHAGQVVRHAELIEMVWGYEHEDSSKIIKGHIRNLRRKLDSLGCERKIETIPGVGYIFTAASP